MKTCKKCGETYPLTEFEKAITTKDKRRGTCRTCLNTQKKESAVRRGKHKVQEKLKKEKARPILMSIDSQQALHKLIPDLLNYARYVGGGMHFLELRIDYQDVLQDAMLSMLHSSTQPPIAELKWWALRIIRNACVSAVRKAMPVEELDSMTYNPPILPPDFDRELEDKMLRAIDLLSPTHQRVLKARLTGKKYEVLATELGYTVGGLKSVIHDAKKALRRKMDNLPD